MNKFWKYESGIVKIDDQCLYESLFIDGFRYFKPTNDDFKYIVRIIVNKVDVYFEPKLWRFCCCLIDKDFKSIDAEELKQVKEALKENKESLKKRNLNQLTNEDLEKCVESVSKQFLKGLEAKYGVVKEGTNGNK